MCDREIHVGSFVKKWRWTQTVYEQNRGMSLWGTQQWNVLIMAESWQTQDVHTHAHTHTHTHAHTQTRLTYIYNTSLAGSRCLKSSNIVVGTVTKRNLQRSILKNDTLPKHTIWLVSCWGFNGVIYLLTILWEIWTNLQLHMSFVFIFVSQKMHHVGIKKKKNKKLCKTGDDRSFVAKWGCYNQRQQRVCVRVCVEGGRDKLLGMSRSHNPTHLWNV